MMRLAEIPERPAQRAQGEANQSGPSGEPCVQAPDPIAAPHAFSHAEDIGGRNPIATPYRSVADRENPICSFLVKNASVYCNPSINVIQYNASTVERAGFQRLDGNALSVADGRIHAGSEGRE